MFFASTSTKLNLSLFFVFNFSDIKKKKKKKRRFGNFYEKPKNSYVGNINWFVIVRVKKIREEFVD